MRMVLLGAPGSGKGTQGEKLAAELAVPRISTGDALRAAVRSDTTLGRQARAAMEAGDLVADELVVGIVEERLAQADAAAGFILDGFPRNVAQARILDEMLARRGMPPLDTALHLDVPDEEIVKRLLARAGDQGRSDDREEVIRCRIRVYNAETRPLLAYYQMQRKLISVPGVGAVEDVFRFALMALRLSECGFA
ncbi:MAG TPA: adenylate kinase [Nevskia sp.]|nr:adenylate kinase [Nevskia sp.]